MDKKKTYGEKQRAKVIIDSLFSGDLPEETGDDIRLWLTEDQGRDTKHQALEDMFMQSVREVASPAEATFDSLREIHEKLNLPAPELGETRIVPRGRPIFRRAIVRVAAVVIPILVIAGAVLIQTGKDAASTAAGSHAEWLTLTAGNDSGENITLADGSTIALSPGAMVSYPGSFGKGRNVKVSGQALFRVVGDESAPFVVETGQVTITVLGTEFEVTTHEGSRLTTVVLYSGSVRIDAGRHSVTLSPGQMCEYDGNTGLLSVGKARTKGTDSKLDFRMATLCEMLGVIAREYGMRTEIDGRLSNTRYTIRFEGTEDVETVLETIRRLTGNFEYDIKDRCIYITPSN